MWNWTVCPTCTSSPTATAPVFWSAPMTLRIRKSPWPNSVAYSSITTPMCRPRLARSWSSGDSSAKRSRSRSNGGAPARLRMTLPSAAVTMYELPIGRQPCETSVSIRTSPPRVTPTAPKERTSPSSTSAWRPGPRPPLAIPPMIGTPGAASESCSSTSGGKV